MKEYSLWDICVLLFQWIGRCCTSCARLVVNMCSLSLRKWWVFLPTIVLFAAGSLWLTRPSNRWYKVNAVAVVNGPQLDIVKSRYASLNDMPHPKDIRQFKAYDVIDAKHDGSADYIDWKKKHNQTDTLCVRMERRVALQFQTLHVERLPQMEQEIMEYMNADPYFQKAYSVYYSNLQRQARYDQDQVEKLDSLTSQFYFEQSDLKTQLGAQHGLLMGERRVHLFLGEIEGFLERKKQRDAELVYCTAPIVLQQPFVAKSYAVNSPMKYLAIALLAAWLCACAIAYAIERK